MKKKASFLKRFILWLLILGTLFFTGVSVYLQLYGKKIIEETVSQKLSADTHIGSIYYQFPLGFRATQIELKDLFSADGISAQFDLAGLRNRQLHLDKVILIRPSFSFDKIIGNEKDQSDGPTESQPPAAQASSQDNNQKEPPQTIVINQLMIQEGEFSYGSDDKANDFILKDTQASLGNLTFPLSDKISQFDIMAKLVKDNSPLTGSRVEGKGWVNFTQKNMEASFKIAEESGKAGLTADVTSRNNDMTVMGRINAGDLIEKFMPQRSTEAGAIGETVFSAMASLGVTVEAKYSFQTKMDDFKVGNVSFSGTVSSTP